MDNNSDYLIKTPQEELSTVDFFATLLDTFIGKKDSVGMTAKLVREFGGLVGIMEAEVKDLMDCAGLSKVDAVGIALIKDCARRYFIDLEPLPKKVFNAGDVIPHLSAQMQFLTREEGFLICTDEKGKVIFTEQYTSGDTSTLNLSIATIVQSALRYNAANVFFAHNHPSGDSMPSMQDISFTSALFDTLSSVNVVLQDHIIIASHNNFSFTRNKLIRHKERR